MIPNIVWRNVYLDYQKEYPNSSNVEETLKDELCDTLKELKTGNYNEEGLDNVTFQYDDMLGHLKVIDGHASKNALKRRRNMMDGVPLHRLATLISSSPKREGFASILNASLDSKLPACDGGEQMMTKAKMLQSQSKSMATMASHYASTTEIRNAFLADKVEINNEHKKKIKINNLKVARDLGVILEKELKNTS